MNQTSLSSFRNSCSKIVNSSPFLKLAFIISPILVGNYILSNHKYEKIKEAHMTEQGVCKKQASFNPEVRNDPFAYLLKEVTADNIISDDEMLAVISEANNQNADLRLAAIDKINPENITIIDTDQPISLDKIIKQSELEHTDCVALKYKTFNKSEVKYAFASTGQLKEFFAYGQNSAKSLGLKDIGFYINDSETGSHSNGQYEVIIDTEEFKESNHVLTATVDHELAHLHSRAYDSFFSYKIVTNSFLSDMDMASTGQENCADSIAVTMNYIDNAKGIVIDFSYGIIPEDGAGFIENLKRRDPSDVHDSHYNRIRSAIRIAGRELNQTGFLTPESYEAPKVN